MQRAPTNHDFPSPAAPAMPDCCWARETRRRRFSSPYNFRENIDWIRNIVFGPTRRYQNLTQYAPQHFELNSIVPQITLAMIGDVMPTRGNAIAIDDSLETFLEGADYLVLNLEGVLSKDRYVWNSIRHTDDILPFLENLFSPSRTIVALSNNHAADCGWSEFQACYQRLKHLGFQTIGRRDEPSILLEDSIEITCGTAWSNQHCDYISRLDPVAVQPTKAPFRLLYPHWGYELHLHPNPGQIALCRQILTQWDMIVGHHSHCPQPVSRECNALVAYSLGNFVFGVSDHRFHHGIVLRTTIGPAADGR